MYGTYSSSSKPLLSRAPAVANGEGVREGPIDSMVAESLIPARIPAAIDDGEGVIAERRMAGNPFNFEGVVSSSVGGPPSALVTVQVKLWKRTFQMARL